jgi:quercetin dioxygenase-like cupin family protein
MVMKVSHASESRRSELRSENFTGRAWGDLLLYASEVETRVLAVVFEPGSRTYWHSHEGGQVILVTYGEGRVGNADGVHRVWAGDVVFTPPGEEHWHGAGPDALFHQVAVPRGATRFGREVSPEEYDSVS